MKKSNRQRRFHSNVLLTVANKLFSHILNKTIMQNSVSTAFFFVIRQCLAKGYIFVDEGDVIRIYNAEGKVSFTINSLHLGEITFTLKLVPYQFNDFTAYKLP